MSAGSPSVVAKPSRCPPRPSAAARGCRLCRYPLCSLRLAVRDDGGTRLVLSSFLLRVALFWRQLARKGPRRRNVRVVVWGGASMHQQGIFHARRNTSHFQFALGKRSLDMISGMYDIPVLEVLLQGEPFKVFKDEPFNFQATRQRLNPPQKLEDHLVLPLRLVRV